MDEASEREILVAELSAIGCRGAQIGVALAELIGAPDIEPSRKAVDAGVGFTAKRLRLNVGSAEVPGPHSLDVLREAAKNALRSTGKLLSDERTPVVGVVRRGFLNVNPAVVTIRFTPSGSGHGLAIRAVALEGLVKQRAGEKAAELVHGRILAALAPTSP